MRLRQILNFCAAVKPPAVQTRFLFDRQDTARQSHTQYSPLLHQRPSRTDLR
jgi:hypothetical protein